MAFYITSMFLIFLSGSPFTGMVSLFLLSGCLAFSVGLKNSWFLCVLVLVYLGGIMVMFAYMTSVSSSIKILSFNARFNMLIIAFSLGLLAAVLGSEAGTKIWPGISFISSSLPFALFLVGYMLVALINIFILICKEEGPMKMK